MDLHPDCEPLAFLLGTWRGEGSGDYPTIEPFRYFEESTFGHVGKPFLSYSQKTRDAADGGPLHAEVGYLRAVGGDSIELILVQPSGVLEIHSGRVDGQRLELELVNVVGTPTAKSVTDVARRMEVVDEVLSIELDMAAVGQGLAWHLSTELRRVDG